MLSLSAGLLLSRYVPAYSCPGEISSKRALKPCPSLSQAVLRGELGLEVLDPWQRKMLRWYSPGQGGGSRATAEGLCIPLEPQGTGSHRTGGYPGG